MITTANRILLGGILGVVVLSSGGAEKGPSAPAHGEPDRVTFRFLSEGGAKLYYVIEQEFREYGGVPPLLSYTTTIKDRRTIHQKIMPRSTQQTDTEANSGTKVTVVWECDRYEVTEQGMRDTLSFDSVRHQYPPSPLWELGGINGSKCSYFFDTTNGQVTVLNVTPGKCAGETTRRPLSKIGSSCQLTKENFASMLDVMGSYWMPKGPVAIGESWSRTITENKKTFGIVETTVRFTLDDVAKKNGRRVATVQIEGSANLIPQTQPATNPGARNTRATTQAANSKAPANTAAGQPTSQPGTPAAKTNSQREFQIEKFACKGTVEFDLDRGELASMTLQRELAFVAKVESEKSGPMELHSGSSHTIKIKSGHTPPPKPIIVGGPKPPDEPKEPEPKRTTVPARRSTPQTSTTRPTNVRPPQITPATTQPGNPQPIQPHAATTQPNPTHRR